MRANPSPILDTPRSAQSRANGRDRGLGPRRRVGPAASGRRRGVDATSFVAWRICRGTRSADGRGGAATASERTPTLNQGRAQSGRQNLAEGSQSEALQQASAGRLF